MKNIFIKLVFLSSFFCLNLIYSQNLVNNPSFEENSECPYSHSQLELSIGWINPTLGTPDYFNSCTVFENVSTPNNFLSYQIPKTGVAYSGIGVYHNIIENGREYLETKLLVPLNNNYCYLVSMYVSLYNYSGYASNNLGIFLSNDSIYSNDEIVLNQYNPHVVSKKIIYDTLNWVKIQGVFKSINNEQFLTIGSFKNDFEIDLDFCFPNQDVKSYYYIDDVSVIPIDSLPNRMPAYAGKDTLITPGDSIFIGQDIINLNCKWSILETGEIIADSLSGLYVSPIETTTYLVEQELCGLITYDTLTIFIDDAGLEQQITTNKKHKIIISPNPNSGIFTIDIGKLSNIQEINIIDALGRTIKHLELNNSKIDVKLCSGVYFLEVKTDKNRLLEKIVVN